MDNDLISRDALKKCAIPCEIHNGTLTDLCVPIYQIDNAPTVEDRPQGKWEEPFERNGKSYHKCNHCHISSELILIDNFCPNCGADMRKEGNR